MKEDFKTVDSQNQAHYDEEYFQGNGQSGDRIALKFYSHLLRRYVKDGSEVLEYGAGEGYLARRLSQFFKTSAYDLSEYCRSQIRKIAPESTVYDDIEAFPDNHFDAVICLHTLEHIPQPEGMIARFAKTLKSGGVMLFVVPNPDGLGHKIKKEKWFGYRDNTHVSMLKPSEWKQRVQDAGFEVVKTSSDGFWDVPYLPLIPNFIQKLIFFPSAALIVFMNRIFYPEWFGEDLIMVAKKK